MALQGYISRLGCFDQKLLIQSRKENPGDQIIYFQMNENYFAI